MKKIGSGGILGIVYHTLATGCDKVKKDGFESILRTGCQKWAPGIIIMSQDVISWSKRLIPRVFWMGNVISWM